MTEAQKTHRLVKDPKMTARMLADYMAASETAGRAIVQKSKYPKIAQVFQHGEAKILISRFVRSGSTDTAELTEEAQKIRDRMADSDFERDSYDHNADYIDRFAAMFAKLNLPDVELLPPGKSEPMNLKGVKVTSDIHWRLRRLTKKNAVKVGAAMLRYTKGRALAEEVADWQSAIILGHLRQVGVEEAAEPEAKLCITVDAYAGKWRPAPTDSVRRFNQTKDACATIAEWWPNIKPPAGAIF